MWILVGALVGAAAGAASVIITAKLRGQEIDWRDVGAAAVTGAVTGAIASATFGMGLAAGPVTRVVAGAAIGAVAGAGGTMLSNELHGRPLMQNVRNAAIAGAVGGALGGAVIGPVAPGIAPTVTRTVASGAVGNAAAQATENALDGRPILENVGTAALTGGVVAGGAHVAATRLAPPAEPAGTVPRPNVPPPALEGEVPRPAVPTTPATTADAPVPAPRGPPTTGGTAPGAPQDGITQILEKLGTPNGQSGSTTSTGTSPNTETPSSTAPSNAAPSNGSASNGSTSNESPSSPAPSNASTSNESPSSTASNASPSNASSSSNGGSSDPSEVPNRPLGGEAAPEPRAVPGTVYEPGSPEFAQLIQELQANGTKLTPADVVRATKLPDGRIAFLEQGTTRAQAEALGRPGGAGLAHIVEEHAPEFAQAGVPESQIPDAVMKALADNNVVGYQGKGTSRPIYEVNYNGRTLRLAITVGKNGFVVGANPRSTR